MDFNNNTYDFSNMFNVEERQLNLEPTKQFGSSTAGLGAKDIRKPKASSSISGVEKLASIWSSIAEAFSDNPDDLVDPYEKGRDQAGEVYSKYDILEPIEGPAKARRIGGLTTKNLPMPVNAPVGRQRFSIFPEAEEEVVAEEVIDGLMRDPRKLGGSEGYGSLGGATEEVASVKTVDEGKGLMSGPLKSGGDELPYSTGIVEGSTKKVLLETQSRLKDLGFYENKVDGITGPATRSAIKTFQYKNGLDVTGITDDQTRLKLSESKGLTSQPKPQTTLLSFISKGEGGYGAANNGTSSLVKKFSMSDGYYSDTYNKPLTEMTVNELMNAQVGTTGKTTEELLLLDPESETAQRNRDLFAAGAYQIIPKTMWSAASKGLVDGSEVFGPKVQDKVAMEFLAGSDKLMLQAFLAGKTKVTIGKNNLDVTVDAAMLDLAKQWASAPVPKTQTVTWKNKNGSTGSKKIVAGKSYYGSGNRSQHTVAETKAMLLQARDENTL